MSPSGFQHVIAYAQMPIINGNQRLCCRHSRKSATIRESNHGSGVRNKH